MRLSTLLVLLASLIPTLSLANWYQVNTRSLVIRAEPSVIGAGIGKASKGDKLKVINTLGTVESINGRNGQWVEIEWQDTTAYVFDAYLTPYTLPTSRTRTNHWYSSNANPNLVVRSKPRLTAGAIGSVPINGQVKVIQILKHDTIGGRKGHWVKIQWLGKSGYVFDAYLEPVL